MASNTATSIKGSAMMMLGFSPFGNNDAAKSGCVMTEKNALMKNAK
jgi:hypothetical protein